MTPLPMAKRLVVMGAVAIGALSLGTAGLAGAATAPTIPAAAPALAKFNCAKATKALTRIDRIEARVTAGLPKLSAAEAKATAAGHVRRAKRLEKDITHLKSSKYHARLVARAAAIEAKCHVPAPSTTTPSSTTTSA